MRYVRDGRNFVYRVIMQTLLTSSVVESHDISKIKFWFQPDYLAVSVFTNRQSDGEVVKTSFSLFLIIILYI